MTAGTIARMPNQPRTPARSIRIPDEMWNQAKAVAEARGEDVSVEVRAGLERYIKRNRHLLD